VTVVVDTNVFISSFLNPHGSPRRIIDLLKTGKIVLCISSDIIEEYIEVLVRLGLTGERELVELLELFKRSDCIRYVTPTEKLDVLKADPDDNKFLECAIAAEAPFIISGDKHLKGLRKFRNVEILTPGEFINRNEGVIEQ
jgi:putative PIN family toxin of toxin-antitoxin system